MNLLAFIIIYSHRKRCLFQQLTTISLTINEKIEFVEGTNSLKLIELKESLGVKPVLLRCLERPVCFDFLQEIKQRNNQKKSSKVCKNEKNKFLEGTNSLKLIELKESLGVKPVLLRCLERPVCFDFLQEIKQRKYEGSKFFFFFTN